MKVRSRKKSSPWAWKASTRTRVVGTYVAPKDWNKLISDPDTIVIDTRNDYEVEIGTFKNAIDPNTKTFSEFPEWVRKKSSTRKKTNQKSPCSAPAASAAKRPRPS